MKRTASFAHQKTLQLAFVFCLFSWHTIGQTAARPSLWKGMKRQVQWVMGTRLTIAIESPQANKLLSKSFAIAQKWDRMLSDYKPQSELSQLNHSAGGKWHTVSLPFFLFLQESRHYAQQTQGAFDITIGALTALSRKKKAFTKAQWQQAKAKVGINLLQFAPKHRVRLRKKGVRLDAGGIGKGYAIDQIVIYLQAHHVTRAWIDFGGSSFYGLGKPLGQKGWPILLRSAKPGRFGGIVYLYNRGLSSSQSLRLIEYNAPRKPHIFSPHTGKLIQKPRFSAVLCKKAADAEVLSTVLVMKPALWNKLSQHFKSCSIK